jgi:hypothetical protein
MKKLLLCSLLMLVGAVSAAWADTYKLVTNASTLADGDQIIVVGANSGSYYAMTPTVSKSTTITASSVTCSNNEIELEANQTDVQVFRLTANSDGTGFALQQIDGNKQYVIGTASNSTNLKYGAVESAKFNKITITSGNAAIKVIGSRYVRINGSSDFRAYTSSNGKDVSIYRYVQTKTDVTLAWNSSTASGDIAKKDDFVAPKLTVDPEAAATSVVYSSENEKVATVNASTGAVTLIAEGETKIWAKISNNASYNDAAASYTLTVTDSDVKVAKPTISVNANEVTLSADEDCSIYYTLDGNDPTKESTAYDNTPFDVTKDCTVKAIAYDAEGNASKVESADVTYVRVATPSFNPASEYVASGTTVTIATATEGAKILYFLNDATEATEYSEPLTITEATTIRAYATAAHYGDSETATQSYQIGSFVTMTSTLNATNFGITPKNATYTEYKYDDTTVGAKYSGFLNTNTNGDDIFSIRPYQNNGGGGIVTLVSPGTIKSITLTQFKNQTTARSVDIYGSHTPYSKGQQDDSSTACFGTKLFDKATELNKGQAVTVDLSTLSEQYEYLAIASTDGACQFSSIEITWNVVKEAGTVVVNAPKITNDGNLVTITPNEDDNKDNTVIYYTTDGNAPTAESTQYEAPFTITAGCTVKAIAYVGDVASEVTSTDVKFATVATPTLSISSDVVLAGQTVTVSCSTDNATIYYAFGDNDYAIYSAPLTINEATTLHVKATRANYADSEVATADYTIGEAVAYTLVTSADQMIDGGKYLIAHNDDSVILGKYNSNNFFPTTAFTKDNTTISVAENSQSVNVVTFEYNSTLDCWNIKTGLEGKYIAAGSSSSNNVYLYQEIANISDNNGDINSLTFADDGQTCIKFNFNGNNCFKYSGTYFSCYSKDGNVKLYKLVEQTTPETPDTPDVPSEPTAQPGTVDFTFTAEDVADFSDSSSNKAVVREEFSVSADGVSEYNNNYILTCSSGNGILVSMNSDDYVKGIAKVELSFDNYNGIKTLPDTDNSTTTMIDGEDNIGQFSFNNTNLVWETNKGTLAKNLLFFPNESYVIITNVIVTWDYVTPSFVQSSVNNDTRVLTVQAKDGQSIYYQINSFNKSNAPALKAVSLSDLTQVADGSDNWEGSDGVYTYDLNKLSASNFLSVYAVNGTKISAASSYSNDGPISGIEGVAADSQNAPVEYYTLQGVRVNNPATGLYIRRQGTKVEKVAIR